MFEKLINNTRLVRQLRAESKAKELELSVELAGLRVRVRHLERKLEPRPARFQLEGAMSEEEIGRRLAGTKDAGPVKAIMAHISAKIVAGADRATDAPRETISQGDRVLAPYTSEMRLHDAGITSGFAELLADLQTLTDEAKPEEGNKSP